MKLNQKGYMLVEIILASVLAMTIAYFLLNLTYQFKNTSEDIYQSVTYENDKIAITKNIMSDLDRVRSGNIICNEEEVNEMKFTNCDFAVEMKKGQQKEKRRLQIGMDETLKTTTVRYGKIEDNGSYDTNDVSYYEKKLQKSLNIGKVVIKNDLDYVTITIPIQSLYEEKKYNIYLIVNTFDDVVIEKYKIIYHGNGYYYDNNGDRLVLTPSGDTKTVRDIKFGEEVEYNKQVSLENSSFSYTGYVIYFNDSYIGEYGDAICDENWENCVDNTYDIFYPATIDKDIIQKVKFVGWSTNEKGKSKISNPESYIQLEKLSNNELHLYAIWELKSISLPSAQKITGCEFKGWNLSDTMENEIFLTASDRNYNPYNDFYGLYYSNGDFAIPIGDDKINATPWYNCG